MSINQRLLIIALGLTLAACQTVPEVKVPEKVYITVEKYIPIDPDLTKDCEIAMPENMSVKEAVRVAKARRTALEKCNEDKRAIRSQSGKAASTTQSRSP